MQHRNERWGYGSRDQERHRDNDRYEDRYDSRGDYGRFRNDDEDIDSYEDRRRAYSTGRFQDEFDERYTGEPHRSRSEYNDYRDSYNRYGSSFDNDNDHRSSNYRSSDHRSDRNSYGRYDTRGQHRYGSDHRQDDGFRNEDRFRSEDRYRNEDRRRQDDRGRKDDRTHRSSNPETADRLARMTSRNYGRGRSGYEDTRTDWSNNYRDTRGSGYGYAGSRIRREDW